MTAPTPRKLDRDWCARHVAGQADASLPPGRIQLRYEDGSLVFDRLGRPRMFSEHVAVKMQRGQLSSRTVQRRAAEAAEAARIAAEAERLRGMVLPSLQPLAGRLWSVHPDALLLIGPGGGIPVSTGAVAVLAPLAAGGRHALDERVRSALDGLAPRLAAVGLRIDRRAAGVRIAKKTKQLQKTSSV